MNQKKIIIHIGSGKTGTSSIQSALSRSDSEGIGYPVVERDGHQNIEILFKPQERITRGTRAAFSNKSENYLRYKDSFEKKIIEQIESYSNLVISSEYLFSMNVEEIRKLKIFFETFGFKDFKIVVYLRNPEDYYLSFVQQQLKASHVFFKPNAFKANFNVFVTRWCEVFGVNNIIVREFKKDNLLRNDVVNDFADIVSKQFGIEFELESNYTNESISPEGMVLLQDYRTRFYSDFENIFKKDSNLLLNRINKLGFNKKPKLNEISKQAVYAINKDDIVSLNEKFGIFNDYINSRDGDVSLQEGFSDRVESILDNFNAVDYMDLSLNIMHDLLNG